MEPANRNHLEIYLSSSQKNRNSLVWVLLDRVSVLSVLSSEGREWELWKVRAQDDHCIVSAVVNLQEPDLSGGSGL